MTDLTVLAQTVYSDTIQAIKGGPSGYDTIARTAAIAVLRTLRDHLGQDYLNGGDLQDLIDTLKDTR